MRNSRGIFEKVADSGQWWIRYVDAQGRYRREKAGVKSTAVLLYRKRKQQALEGRKLPEKLRCANVSFREVVSDALEYSRQQKRSHRSDVCMSETLLGWFADRAADSITAQEIEARLDQARQERGWAPSTYNHYRSLLSLAYRLAKRSGKVSANPARDVPHKREDNSRVRYLTAKEETRLARVIRANWPEHLDEYIFAKHTGLRLGSQYGLTWGMVDWALRMLHIPRTKNEEPLHLPLNDEAMAVLRRLRFRGDGTGFVFRSERWPDRQLRSNDHWFKPALLKAEISNFRWHDLRHDFASQLRQKGVPLETIAELLGHKGLTMAKRYSHLSVEHLRQAVSKLVRNRHHSSTSTVSRPAVEPVHAN